MAKDGEWNTIDVSQNAQPQKVEFEIEGQEETTPPVKEVAKAPVQEVEQKEQVQNVQSKETYEVEGKEEQDSTPQAGEEKEKELAGIETRGAQKRIRQLIRQRKEREEEIARLRGEVENLKNTVGFRERELTETVKSTIESNEKQLESRLSQAKILYKKATEQGDTDGMLAAQEEISRAYAEEVALRQKKEAITEHSQRLEQQTAARKEAAPAAQQQAQPQYDPKAIDWARRNEWFGKDQLMTNAALSIDAQLKQEGFDPSDEEYYEEVDARMASQFPTVFTAQNQNVETERATSKQEPRSKPAQVVSGASRSPKTSSSSKNRVKLTQRDVVLAQKWGIPLEQYAAEKLKAEQAEGEYTTVQ